MAPEIIDKKYEYQCDLWASGILMYYLLSGTFPFQGSTYADVLINIRSQKLSFESSVWEKVTDESKDLIQKLLTKNPVIRSTAELALNH
jgi:calcium-dependent protein kinase